VQNEDEDTDDSLEPTPAHEPQVEQQAVRTHLMINDNPASAQHRAQHGGEKNSWRNEKTFLGAVQAEPPPQAAAAALRMVMLVGLPGSGASPSLTQNWVPQTFLPTLDVHLH
jgi:hypothetical protein